MVICKVAGAFFERSESADWAESQRRLCYLKPLARRMREVRESFARARWGSDFAGFFLDCVYSRRMDRDILFFHPTECEVSLSRCLFNSHSPYRRHIDVHCQNIGSIYSGQFTGRLVTLCLDLIPDRAALSLSEQSVALLLFLRAVFNRCYELNESYFARPSDPEVFAKMKVLSRIEVFHFPLPWRLLPTGDRSIPVGSLFGKDPFFQAAAQFLAGAVFEPNPIDAIYAVHKSLTVIQKAAIIYGRAGTEVRPQDIAAPISFDDMFSLFFGVFLGSGIVDIFSVGKMISEFAPRAFLSPPFEYALANLEALVLHCAHLTVAEVQQQFFEGQGQ